MKSLDAGISVKISSAPRIEDNWLSQNSVGIHVVGKSSPVIVHNEIVDGYVGVKSEQNQATLSWNIVEKQTSAAFYFHYAHIVDFHKNNIADNSGWYVHLNRGPDVDAGNNWWGVVDGTVIASKIRDGQDLPSNSKEQLGAVKYEPFEVEPVREVGVITAPSGGE